MASLARTASCALLAFAPLASPAAPSAVALAFIRHGDAAALAGCELAAHRCWGRPLELRETRGGTEAQAQRIELLAQPQLAVTLIALAPGQPPFLAETVLDAVHPGQRDMPQVDWPRAAVRARIGAPDGIDEDGCERYRADADELSVCYASGRVARLHWSHWIE